jgi:hypothetical protein
MLDQVGAKAPIFCDSEESRIKTGMTCQKFNLTHSTLRRPSETAQMLDYPAFGKYRERFNFCNATWREFANMAIPKGPLLDIKAYDRH